MVAKRAVITNLVLLILFGLVLVAEAAPEWQVTLSVTSGSGKAKLELGADTTATDVYDKVWDSPAMLGGALRAYFPRPDWQGAFENYWRDIRAKAPGLTSDWTFVIESDTPNSNVTVKWDLSLIPGDYSVSLILDDMGRRVIDMRSDTSYSFGYTAPRTLRVSVSAPPEPLSPENRPPVANAGADQTIEVASCDGAAVILNGSASTDPDGDALTYVWTWDGGRAEGPNPTITLPMGTTVVTLTVDDGKGATSTDTVSIGVNDSVAATLDVVATPNILWPPNHRYVVIGREVFIKNVCVPATKVELLSVMSNEPDATGDDGDQPNDIVIRNDGTLLLRAERSRYGSGRVYTITYQATDEENNQTTGTALVFVPLKEGKIESAGTAELIASHNKSKKNRGGSR